MLQERVLFSTVAGTRTTPTHTHWRHMNPLSFLPRHNCIPLSPTNTLHDLQAHHQEQLIAQEDDFRQVLTTLYKEDAALVQYSLRSEAGVRIPVMPRVKEASLPILFSDSIYVSMDWVLLDWDLPSKGTPWGDPSKPETQSKIEEFIRNHPHLKYAYAFYFSKSGVRLMFALANPLEIKDLADVDVWKQFYASFVGKFDISSIGGEIEKRSDPFAMSRTPHYQTQHGDIVFLNTTKRLRVTYPSKEAVEISQASRTSKEYAKLDPQQASTALRTDPLIVYLRENPTSLSYQDWRGLGTNIASLFGADDGRKIFEEVSSWDPQYDPKALDSQWHHIVQSAEQYGPTTWQHFQLDLTTIYGEDQKPTSSLAGSVHRAVNNAQAAVPPPSLDNSKAVRKKLFTVERARGGQTIQVPTKCPSNLMTILQEDNRWQSKIRRNHLGSLDMLGDRPLVDEDVTAIRETISRIYDLQFSKDDIWDFIKLIACQNNFHPVYDYLTALQWDGQDRIGGLAQSLGQSSPFTETILRRFLISCVVRPLEWENHAPTVNWKIDTVLILKGGQGKRKSSFFKDLCASEDWFSDSLPSITAERKDAALHMLGHWMVEQAEFEGHVARSSVESMKAFITREREIFRKAYGRAEINMRRPSVLVGTTNSSNFLNDPTGDRRFWVVEIPEEHTIDRNWVKLNRDQLWAQAVAMYRSGEPWWLSESEAQQSNTHNERYRRPSALNEAVLEFLNTNPTMASIRTIDGYLDGIGFTLKQLVSIGLDKKLADIKGSEAQSITTYLSTMGWDKIRTRVEGQRMYVFRKRADFDDEREEY